MLNLEALESAMPLAAMLDERRTYLSPAPQTPLDVLVKATRSDDKFNFFDTENKPTPDIGNIFYIANAKDPVLGYAEHDLRMDEVVPQVIEAVQGHIKVAKALVAPVVAELAQKVAETLNAGKKVSELQGLEVIIWQPSELLSNSAFEKEVRNFEHIPFADPQVRLNLPSKSYPELLDMMATGKGSVDDDIKLWAATKGDTYFLTLWNTLFQIQGEAVPRYHDFVSDRGEGIDYALAVYLLSRRLLEEIPENTGVSLTDYTRLVEDYRDQAALRICVAMDELERDLKAGRLIRVLTNKTVTVNGRIYKEWIENGGSNEVLFGNMLSGKEVYTVGDLNDQKSALQSIWVRHENNVRVAESTQRFNRLIAALRAGFQQQMLHLAEGEDTTIENLTLVNKLFEEELNKVCIDDADNLYQLCLKLVCRSRFYRTNAECILGAIDRFCRENPGIDVREAAAMATIEYVADWVAALIKPTVT
jgi:hypothetical protein